jgi:hypothetical protein
VVAPGAVMRVCAEASPDQRDRPPCLCSLRRTTPWWRSFGGCWVCSELRLWRDSALVTTAQESTACFDLLSQLVGVGSVLPWVCLFCSGCVRVVVLASTRYVQLLPY